MSSIRVEVVLALARGVDAVTLTLRTGSTVRDAVAASGLGERHPGIDLGAARRLRPAGSCGRAAR